MLRMRLLAAMVGLLPLLARGELDQHLTKEQVNAPQTAYSLVSNSAFVPPVNYLPARQGFSGTLAFQDQLMNTDPAKFASNDVLGKDPQLFPGVRISFITRGDELIPLNQDIIRHGSLPGTKSWWDFLVQPGKIWAERQDGGWSRASFPFALMNSLDGETRNGVAMFLFKDGNVTNVRYQITSETAPFIVSTEFVATGVLVPDRNQLSSGIERDRVRAAMDSYEDEEGLRTRPWEELQTLVGSDTLSHFDTSIQTTLTADAIRVGDNLYIRSCPTVAGELPYCDRQRFGMQSATKSAALGVALLRVAEKYDPNILNEKIANYVPEARAYLGWNLVTFADAFNMATGMGYGSTNPNNGIDDPFADVYMKFWYATTAEGKLKHLLADAKPYPWGPGKIARYRDEDMYLIGVALERFVQSREGPNATLWKFVNDEVYRPIGIRHIPIDKTLDTVPKQRQPLMAWGLYATVADMAKISKLYQNHGAWNGRQILNRKIVDNLLYSRQPVGFSTGHSEEPYYFHGFWRPQYASKQCSFYFPMMDGYGDIYSLLLPNDVTVVRIAHNGGTDPGAKVLTTLTAAANSIRPLCSSLAKH
jgi:CubicO group peptidase (beta-lactamase class C family)